MSAVQAGKPALDPESQAEEVDALWREWFPGAGERCSLFAHHDREAPEPADLAVLSRLPAALKCDRLILAGPHWNDPERWEAKDMLARQLWNGARHQNTEGDGSVARGLVLLEERRPGRFTADWLAVTIDYHH